MASRIDDTVLPKNFYSHCSACIDIERHGLSCFDKDGNYGGWPGDALIIRLIEVFEEVEMYKECAFLQDFLVEYRSKFHPAN